MLPALGTPAERGGASVFLCLQHNIPVFSLFTTQYSGVFSVYNSNKGDFAFAFDKTNQLISLIYRSHKSVQHNALPSMPSLLGGLGV